MLRRTRRLLALPPERRWAIIAAIVALIVTRVGLRLLGFGRWWRLQRWLLRRGTSDHKPRLGATATHRVAWGIDVASGVSWGQDTCLTRALAGHLLLGVLGHSATIRVGVRHDEQKEPGLAAHAWVEAEGEPVIGARALAREHAALPPIGSANA